VLRHRIEYWKAEAVRPALMIITMTSASNRLATQKLTLEAKTTP
jgi:hypothetical protein